VLTLEGTGALVDFSPAGRHIVTARQDNKLRREDRTLKVWDAESGRQILTLMGNEHSMDRPAFSPDGKRIAWGDADGTIKLWEVESGQEVLALKGHTGYVQNVAFSPDGTRIISRGTDATKIWDGTPMDESTR
jgi:WD40 repeat protein